MCHGSTHSVPVTTHVLAVLTQGVSPEGMAGFFGVGKALYGSAPWRCLAASDVISCAFTLPGDATPTQLYCVSMGQIGSMYGFSFYEVQGLRDGD